MLMYGSFILCVKVLSYVGKFYLMWESFILCVEWERVELCEQPVEGNCVNVWEASKAQG